LDGFHRVRRVDLAPTFEAIGPENQ
jgi:hypothetical protein